MEPSEFNTQLNELRNEAQATHTLNDHARIAQYRTLARVYLVYRDLSQSPQLLAEAYRAAGIAVPSAQQNSPSFRPFLRLIYDIVEVSPYMNNKLTRWSAVLGQLDQEYGQRSEYFGADPIPRLASYIEQQGGLSAMHDQAKSKGDVREPTVAEVALTPSVAKRKVSAVLAKSQANAELAKRRLHVLAKTTHNAVASFTPKLPLQTHADNLVAMIGRVEPNGSVTVLVSSHAAEAVNAVAANADGKEYGGLPPALAVLSETVSLQRFPDSAKPAADKRKAWRDRVFYDTASSAKAAAKLAASGVPQTTPRRLMLCGASNTVVLSNMRRERGVTIVSKPTAMALPNNGDFYLKTGHRWDVEQLVASGEIELWNAEPCNQLRPVDGALHSHALDLRNGATDQHKRLYFYRRGRENDNAANNWQGAIDCTTFKPDWTASVTALFFAELRVQHFETWMATLGRDKQLLRENNREHKLILTKEKFLLEFNSQTHGKTPDVPMAIAATLAKGAQCFTYSYRSKDIAPVFYNLSDVAATSQITLKGNADALLISFSTTVAAYTIAIPTTVEHVPANTIFRKGA